MTPAQARKSAERAQDRLQAIKSKHHGHSDRGLLSDVDQLHAQLLSLLKHYDQPLAGHIEVRRRELIRYDF